MTAYPKLDAALSVGDKVVLWVVVLLSASVLAVLAIRADRDPAALISPACLTVPTKAPK